MQASVQEALAKRQPALPEAAFSLCLRGRLDGQDAQVTIRGATADAFRANLRATREVLEEARGLLDPLPAPSQPPAVSQARPSQAEASDEPEAPRAVLAGAAPQAPGWCAVHNVQMKLRKATNGGNDWWSHQKPGVKVYCRGEGYRSKSVASEREERSGSAML